MDATDYQDPRMGDLKQKIEEKRAEILELPDSGLLPVAAQIRECELNRQLWMLLQEQSLFRGDTRSAVQCSKEARDWSAQQTRAIKQKIADKVYALEVAVEGNTEKKAKLGKLAVVK